MTKYHNNATQVSTLKNILFAKISLVNVTFEDNKWLQY